MSVRFSPVNRRRFRPAFDLLESRATPATLVAPDLLTQSDTGASRADNVTSVVLPAFAGATTSPPGSAISLEIDGAVHATWIADGRSTFVLSATTPLANGARQVRFYDGFSRAYSAALTIVVDAVAPQMPTSLALTPTSDTGVVGDGITSTAQPTFVVRAEAGTTIYLHIGSLTFGLMATGADQEMSVDVSSLGDGSVSVWAEARDVAGNLSGASDPVDVVFDRTAPSAPTGLVLAPESDTGTASDGLTSAEWLRYVGIGEPGASATLTLDGVVRATAPVGPDGTFTLEHGPVSEGEHSAIVTLTDAAGNVGAAAGPVVTFVDLTPPEISQPFLATLALSPNGDGLQDGSPLFFGLSEPARVRLVVYDANQAPVRDVDLGELSDGSQEIPFDVSGFPDGEYTYTLDAVDSAGGASATAAGAFLVDRVGPTLGPTTLAATSDTGVSQTDRITQETTLVWNGTAEPGAVLGFYVDDLLLAILQVDDTGAWSIDLDADEGSHVLYVEAWDIAGNGTFADGLPFVIDRTAPTLTIDGPTSGDEGSEIALTATASDATGQRWELVSASNGDTFAPVDGPELRFTPTNDGVYVWRHLAIDDADNEATTETTIDVADVAPTLSAIGPDTIEPNVPYVLSLAFADPGADPLDGWRIVWGDGTTSDLPGSATEATHTFTAPGRYAPLVEAIQGSTATPIVAAEFEVIAPGPPKFGQLWATTPSLLEDTANPAGFLVSDLTTLWGVTDEPGAALGIAVVAADASHGLWQYALDGTSWRSLGTVTQAAARLLAADATTRMRFVPGADFSGPVTFSARAWEASATSNGALGDASIGGGVSAFSADVALGTVPVTSVNDAPTLETPAGIESYRNQPRVFGPGLRVVDVDATRTRVSMHATNGTLNVPVTTGLNFMIGNGTPYVTVDGPLSAVNASLAALFFKPYDGYLGPVEFTGSVIDFGATGDATPKTASAEMSFGVLNRPPTLATSTLYYATNANTALTAGSLLSVFADPDGDPLTLVLASAPTAGSVTLNADGTFTYTPALGFVGVATFQVFASDGIDTSAVLTVSIEVKSVFRLRR